jgi:peptidoglycan/xylan/chitin deacetylase (PgdA/CDA1 family)
VRIGAVLGAAAAGHLLPSVLSVPVCRPLLSGAVPRPSVALTFDDGPDPESTPQFLDALRRLQAPATFFVLGRHVADHPELTRRIAAEGHEIAVHGWVHRTHLLRSPSAVATDLRRAHRAVLAATGTRPRHWRPPHGVLTGAGLAAGALLGMSPVLWTADGADWAAAATPETVLNRITQRLSAGGVVLLHDSDRTSAPGSWRTALATLDPLVAACRARGWPLCRVDGIGAQPGGDDRAVA